jgi:D-mannonate dehydratase
MRAIVAPDGGSYSYRHDRQAVAPHDPHARGPLQGLASEQIKKEIAALKADKSIAEAEKKEDLAQLEAALKTAKPVQFKENIPLVLKYFDKLAPIMQEQDSNLRPAD